MSTLVDAAHDYLRLRNSLGHDLAEYHRELPRLVALAATAGGRRSFIAPATSRR